MLSKEQELRRNVVEFLTIEDRIPRDHLLRKIDGAIDFCHLYDFVDLKGLYSEQQGRPSVDPVVLFKIVLLQHLYGIFGFDLCDIRHAFGQRFIRTEIPF